MASHRNPNPTIVLAANSPLYAPVLLANAEGFNKTCSGMKLEIAKYPISNEDPIKMDPFIDRLLSQTRVDKEILIGIGDPMRMTAVSKDNKRHAEAKVVGTLIDKMCYWLVDHRYNFTEKWEDLFHKLLVHPKGMAGYTVPSFDFIIRNSGAECSSLLEDEHEHSNVSPASEIYAGIGDILIDSLDPNNEREIYDALNTELARLSQKPSKPLAFITTNPLHITAAMEFAEKYSVARKFYEGAHLRNIIMTAIITARQIDEEEGEAISRFKEGVINAIAYIHDSPALAAYHLYQAYETGKLRIVASDGSVIKPFFASWRLTDLESALVTLTNIPAYNHDLKTSQAQWERTKRMRSIVEPLLDDEEKARKAETLTERNCDYYLPSTEPPKENRMSA